MTESEELKPCAWCGIFPVVDGGNPVDCDQDCPFQGISLSQDMWNSAHCWKEISRLRGLLKEARSLLKEKRMAVELRGEIAKYYCDTLTKIDEALSEYRERI